MKDDSGSYTVFIEQGSSASQMTAAEVMDIISRQPWIFRTSSRGSIRLYSGQNGRRTDVIFKNFPKSECPDIWIRLPEHKRPKLRSSMEDPVVLLERNLYGHPFAGQMRERQFEKVLLEHGWEKVPNWECLVVDRGKGTILVCVCGRFKFLSRLFLSLMVCSLRTKCNVDDFTLVPEYER